MMVYPMLCRIVRKKFVTVASVLSSIPLNISFQRTLVGEKLVEQFEQVSMVAAIVLVDEDEICKWICIRIETSRFAQCIALIQENTLQKESDLWKLLLMF